MEVVVMSVLVVEVVLEIDFSSNAEEVEVVVCTGSMNLTVDVEVNMVLLEGDDLETTVVMEGSLFWGGPVASAL